MWKQPIPGADFDNASTLFCVRPITDLDETDLKNDTFIAGPLGYAGQVSQTRALFAIVLELIINTTPNTIFLQFTNRSRRDIIIIITTIMCSVVGYKKEYRKKKKFFFFFYGKTSVRSKRLQVLTTC